jgi:hypothetical protein
MPRQAGPTARAMFGVRVVRTGDRHDGGRPRFPSHWRDWADAFLDRLAKAPQAD